MPANRDTDSRFPEIKPDHSIIGVVQVNSGKVTSVVARKSSNHHREGVLRREMEAIRFRVDGSDHVLYVWGETIEKDLQQAIEDHVQGQYGISISRAQAMGTAA